MERLFRTYPSFAQGSSAGEILRDRVEKAKVYFEAVEPYDAIDIEAAVRAFLTGSAPGINPSFPPSAPMVGAEVRRQMNLRIDSELRRRRPQLPAPDIVHSPESVARVQALVSDIVERSSMGDGLRDGEYWLPRPGFEPDTSEAAVRRRLGYRDGTETGGA